MAFARLRETTTHPPQDCFLGGNEFHFSRRPFERICAPE